MSFISCNWLPKSKDDNLGVYTYKLIDSSFEEIIKCDTDTIASDKCLAVIVVYEKRKLDVVSNLLKCILQLSRNSPYSGVEDIILVNKKCNPEFHKYEKELERYLILL